MAYLMPCGHLRHFHEDGARFGVVDEWREENGWDGITEPCPVEDGEDWE